MVLAALAVLAGTLLPCLSAAKAQARLSVCAVQMRGVGAALRLYATSHRECFPPFAFSDQVGNLPLSGHWGGPSQPGDPGCFGRQDVSDVNLWRLVADGLLASRQMICPGADCSPEAPEAGYFPYTGRFSTYCLRMLYSTDVFRDVPELAYWAGQGLLGIYTQAGSGHQFHFGGEFLTVPYLRADVRYREADPRGLEVRAVDLAGEAVMSDEFWYQRYHAPAPTRAGLMTYPVRAAWCHGRNFNVLFGDGAVRAVADDGTVAANSLAPGTQAAPDDCYFAGQAIRVWRYFHDRH